MGYRAATTVVTLLAVAFAIQLIAVLTVPVTHTITLCTYDGYKFGALGFCNNNGTCSPVQIGYSATTVEEPSVFSLPSNTRRSISKLLVVHPISCGFTFLLLVFSFMIYFTAPSQNLRFLFFLLLWSLPTFLLSLLCFLVDILLFAPHLDWSGWIILGSTVLIAICGAMFCLMRRSTSSRIAMYQNNKLMSSHGNSNRYFLNGFEYYDDDNDDVGYNDEEHYDNDDDGDGYRLTTWPSNSSEHLLQIKLSDSTSQTADGTQVINEHNSNHIGDDFSNGSGNMHGSELNRVSNIRGLHNEEYYASEAVQVPTHTVDGHSSEGRENGRETNINTNINANNLTG